MSNMHTRRKTRAVHSSLSKTGRKSLWTIETNVASYDRTDPFTALNVLRKLIASLSTRLGGCQYKMTPEEHKLSMHLLTIIEPFVGHSQSRRTLVRQPTEILDEIIFQLHSKRDLFNLALCQVLGERLLQNLQPPGCRVEPLVQLKDLRWWIAVEAPLHCHRESFEEHIECFVIDSPAICTEALNKVVNCTGNVAYGNAD